MIALNKEIKQEYVKINIMFQKTQMSSSAFVIFLVLLWLSTLFLFHVKFYCIHTKISGTRTKKKIKNKNKTTTKEIIQ